jgi:plasmid stabilization system protein ParE
MMFSKKQGHVCEKMFDIVFSHDATDDLFGIVDYLNSFSPNIGEKYFNEIEGKTDSLRSMPERCSFVACDELRQRGYRWIFVRNYTIFFTIHTDPNIVVIRRILYARREYTALL